MKCQCSQDHPHYDLMEGIDMGPSGRILSLCEELHDCILKLIRVKRSIASNAVTKGARMSDL